MSKYLTYQDIQFRDETLLCQALAKLGYDRLDKGEGLPLYGYEGDERPERAEIVIRRRHIDRLANDVGFKRTPQGFIPIISEYDQVAIRGGRFLADLRTAYSELTVQEVARRLRGTVQREQEGQLTRLRVRF